MAVTAQATGTTLADGTEQFLANVALAGSYTLHFDSNPMAAGDVVELRIYQMVLTAGTPRVAYLARYAEAQFADDLIKISVPISNELVDPQSLRFSMRQTAGTYRTFVWKVLRYA